MPHGVSTIGRSFKLGRDTQIDLTNGPGLGAQTDIAPFGTKPDASQYVAALKFDRGRNARGGGVAFIKKLQRGIHESFI